MCDKKHTICFLGQSCTINYVDTAGCDEYQFNFRPLLYLGTNMFILCFSVVWPPSLNNAKEKWVRELTHYHPMASFLLVGTKCDLRDDKMYIQLLNEKGMKPVTYQHAVEVAKAIGAIGY